MTSATPPPPKEGLTAPLGAWKIDGRWFRAPDGSKIALQGVTYGPFAPNREGAPWPEEAQLQRDFALIASGGFNVVRLYTPPSPEVLRAAETAGLRLLVGVSGTQHVDFLDRPALQEEALSNVRKTARHLANNPLIVGLIIGNEIEATLVRWMGPERVRGFLERLVATAHESAPGLPVAYASYPSTEYLIPRNADFVAFNIFLEEEERFAAYLQRLLVMVDGKPLVITEFGLDSRAHGHAAQAEALRWQHTVGARMGLAGNFWFSFTDDWYRGDEQVTGWSFGLVDRDRRPKPAWTMAERVHGPGLLWPSLAALPRFSVVVCTRNGAATLKKCLAALGRQTYSDYEVLVIDDGSTDETPAIAKEFPFVKYHRQAQEGLGAARNHGMREATGEIIAYTDDDCIPDEDWLKQLAPGFNAPDWAAAGGPNLPPPPRNLIEACVAAAPGAPAHVLINDEEAEHLPGCNLAIRKSALMAIGGFREEFTTAGDDVDVCWRLREQGGKLRFLPSAVVWHHRRFTIGAYFRQQRGYGNAEAMLIRLYPLRFAWLGGAKWEGAVYGEEITHDDLSNHLIHFGPFGRAPFQCIYNGSGNSLTYWLGGLTWLGAAGMTVLFSVIFSGWWLAVTAAMLIGTLSAASRRAAVHDFTLKYPTWQHRALLWALCVTQPPVREWARLRGMVRHKAVPRGRLYWSWKRKPARRRDPSESNRRFAFWSDRNLGREEWQASFEREIGSVLKQTFQPTDGWSVWDGFVRVYGLRLATASMTEFHGGGKTLTRVKLSRSFLPTAGLGVAGLVAIAGVLVGGPALALISGVVLAICGALFGIEKLAEKRLARVIIAAGQNAGLSRMEGGSVAAFAGQKLPLAARALDSH